MHPCLENLERIINDSDTLFCRRKEEYDDMVLRITDRLITDTEDLITAEMISTNEILLTIRITNPLFSSDDKVMREIYEFLFSLAKKSNLEIAPDDHQQFGVSVRFRCWRNLTDLEKELEANLDILRMFVGDHGMCIRDFLRRKGFN